jgi:pantoate--beta-alanine ligase
MTTLSPYLAPTPTPPVQVLDTVTALVALLDSVRSEGRTVGLVPTMGALHAGHASLIERAAAECDVAVVTIFVNPLQFGDPGDLASYPRSLDGDVAMAAAAGARLVFAPPVAEMYPDFPATVATTVSVSGVSDQWEGASRPGHFDGVATVVTKLFGMAGRCRAYFGEKDFQQLAVVRRLVDDLCLPVEVVGCPIVRDEDGLALSSRNTRLGDDQRRAALVLSQALVAGAELLSQGGSPSEVEARMVQVVAATPEVTLDYAALVRAGDLGRPGRLPTDHPLRLLIAAQVGTVRLIDNLDPVRPGLATSPAPVRPASEPVPSTSKGES